VSHLLIVLWAIFCSNCEPSSARPMSLLLSSSLLNCCSVWAFFGIPALCERLFFLMPSLLFYLVLILSFSLRFYVRSTLLAFLLSVPYCFRWFYSSSSAYHFIYWNHSLLNNHFHIPLTIITYSPILVSSVTHFCRSISSALFAFLFSEFSHFLFSEFSHSILMWSGMITV